MPLQKDVRAFRQRHIETLCDALAALAKDGMWITGTELDLRMDGMIEAAAAQGISLENWAYAKPVLEAWRNDKKRTVDEFLSCHVQNPMNGNAYTCTDLPPNPNAASEPATKARPVSTALRAHLIEGAPCSYTTCTPGGTNGRKEMQNAAKETSHDTR